MAGQGEINLHDTLESLEASNITQRKEGIADLKHILRNNPRLDTLSDKSFLSIFQALFQLALTERSNTIKGKTEATRTLASNRLIDIAGALRMTVETGVRIISRKTLRAVYDHVTQTIYHSSGAICEPLALDYAKCLRAIFSFQPHVEWLTDDWEGFVAFCIECIGQAESEGGSENAMPSTMSTNGLSYRSSRSANTQSGASQGSRSTHKAVAEEMIGCLRLLTAAPNAPMRKKAPSILWTIIDFLKSSGSASRSNHEGFTAINNVLSWTRTEEIGLTQEVTSHLIRLIKQFWSPKSNATDQMLVTLLLLRPYIFHAMKSESALTLRPELLGLQQAVQAEYSRRQERDRSGLRQLSIDDLRLEVNIGRSVEAGKICTALFTLRCVGARGESNWILTYMLASIQNIFMRSTDGDSRPEPEPREGLSDDSNPRQRKRVRLDDDFSQLLDACGHGGPQDRACALQVLCFLVQQLSMAPARIAKILHGLTSSCSEESGSVASWAFLALACCAAQSTATDTVLAGDWESVWLLACRSLSNASSCRAASYALQIMLSQRLVPQSNVAELVQTITNAIDLSGPSALSDSASSFLISILRASHQSNPAASSSTAESTLKWLSHTFSPSKLDDKPYVMSSTTVDSVDVLTLIFAALNQSTHQSHRVGFQVWDEPARWWILSAEQEELVSYLLLDESGLDYVNTALTAEKIAPHLSSSSATRASCEALILTQLGAEATRANEAWTTLKQERRQPSIDAFTMMCKAAVVFNCVGSCAAFRDSRRQLELQEQASTLLGSLFDFICSPTCDDLKVDALCSAMSTSFSGLSSCAHSSDHHSVAEEQYQPSECEKSICRAIAKALKRRQALKESNDEDDGMDIDEDFNSQGSSQSQATYITIDLPNDLYSYYSRFAMRHGTELYANAIVAVHGEGRAGGNHSQASGRIMDFLLKQSEVAMLSSRLVISKLPWLGAILTPKEIERLWELFMDTRDFLTRRYLYGRSEVALGTFLDVLLSQMSVWTNAQNKSLYEFGLQLYQWWTETVLAMGSLSASVQLKMANLLLRLCEIDPNYGVADDDSSKMMSPRDSLFKLLRQGRTTLQFYLASRISIIFQQSALSDHEQVLEEMNANFFEDADSTEGIALRHLFFAELALVWPSLLRQSVYFMFEAAGRVESSVKHATRCIAKLAAGLPSSSPRKLFSLFAPQLLYTWLNESHPLTKLPFAAFQYHSLGDLLAANESEVCAQVVLLDRKHDLDIMSKALRILPKELVGRSFSKCLAYVIGEDVQKSEDGKAVIEHGRLRDLVGGKEEAKELTLESFPTVMGYMYLTLQQEDPEDKLLQQSKSQSVENVLKEIKDYSYSSRPLPRSQQPSFPSNQFLYQVERLNRRVSEIETQWSPSRITLTVRMLLNNIDDSLGSLHSCLMIRRLRILICMAGDAVYQGFVLEMLVHSLRPFLSDSECVDDVLGILQYLLQHGLDHFQTNLSFLRGNIILMVLQIGQFSNKRSTRHAQRDRSLQRMQRFQQWLVSYLETCLTVAETETSANRRLLNALGGLKLPGNASRNTPESSLLLLLLDQRRSAHSLCTAAHTSEAIRILADGFEAPQSVSRDCLGDDQTAMKYSDQLWDAIQDTHLSEEFMMWATQVVGRAYASSGVRANEHSRSSMSKRQSPTDDGYNIASSFGTIADRILELLFSRQRQEAGLADFCLRKLYEMTGAEEHEEKVFIDKLPADIYEAVCDASFRYEPTSADWKSELPKPNHSLLRQALQIDAALKSLSEWTTDVAVALCAWAEQVPHVAMLAPLFRSVPGLAAQLLPSMIHILLVKEIDARRGDLKTDLSIAITACLSETEPSSQAKQQFCLKLLLYLRGQPFPGEKTELDRLQWLGVDYLLAATAGAKCGMPTSALLLAEWAAPVPDTSRRTSTRVSLSQLQEPSLGDELLLSIYQQLEEPDSFYGVQQPATLESVLHRLDHEGDGFRSLMFRSAQMDSRMRTARGLTDRDAVGMIRSLSTLNFNSLALTLMTHGVGGSASCADEMLNAAKTLQQWDISPPEQERTESSSIFIALQELSRTSDLHQMRSTLRAAVVNHFQGTRDESKLRIPSHSWYSILANLTEVGEIATSKNESELAARWEVFQAREQWMHLAKFEDAHPVLSNRQTLFAILRSNAAIQKQLHVSDKTCHALEARALLRVSGIAREHSRLQEALTAVTSLSSLADQHSATGLNMEGAVKFETASVLWAAGEASASVKLLRDTLDLRNLDKQDIPVGRAGLLAQLGHQLGEARLEKPEEIISKYLKPAISDLKSSKDDEEAGKVHYEFAKYCDDQLQGSAFNENADRIAKLRPEKQEEIDELERVLRSKKTAGDDKRDLQQSFNRARTWLELDKKEEKRLREGHKTYVQQSLQNYLFALKTSDKYNISVLRFFALWLENADDEQANAIALRYLKDVPSWKFVLLMNQLMSRIGEEQTTFQRALQELLIRIFGEHPHHSLHHLFAATQQPAQKDPPTMSRHSAAKSMHRELQRNSQRREFVDNFFQADTLYKALAEVIPHTASRSSSFDLYKDPAGSKVAKYIPKYSLPPVTMAISLRPSGDYQSVPIVRSYERQGRVMSGNSAPKCVECRATNAVRYKQLFKDGDDLRQDAIMEQVFEEVSNMLRNHKATRQRDLKVRTYKVIPLSAKSGIIEFVPNSMPINEWLRPAHARYHPKDYPDHKAREMIQTVQKNQGTKDDRLREYQKVCQHFRPVLRHFYFENFHDPDEWFQKRTAYTRTTASISILGWVLGLGDRHLSNVMLDKVTGEVVHIDLGVAFEAGQALPIPELIPFRLTRDIIDAMGVTRTEGVFRRCCEFTLDAVREDKGSIMTLLNVLRYDPLYSWTVSPARARRMQEAQDTGRNGGGGGGGQEEESSRKVDQEAGEADRSLSVVEKKLSTTLSTAATVNELIQQATDEMNLATLFAGWGAYL